MLLTKEERKHFWETGFLRIRKLVDGETLARLRAATDRFIRLSRAVQKSDDRFDLEPDHSLESPRLRRLKEPIALDDIYREVGLGSSVLDVVESLIGEDIKFHHSKLNFKAGGGGAGVGWHQDLAFFPHTNYDLVACGIALDESNLENGCLLVIPGSHRAGVLSHRNEAGEFVGEIRGESARFDPEQAVPVGLKAGDMSVHHACVIHGSSANRSRHQRRLLIYQYAACDSICLEPAPPKHEYSGRVIRGRPAAHARLEGAVTVPLRGQVRGRSIFEIQEAPQ